MPGGSQHPRLSRPSFPPGLCHAQESGRQRRGRTCPTRPFSRPARGRPEPPRRRERASAARSPAGGSRRKEGQCLQRAPREPKGTRGREGGPAGGGQLWRSPSPERSGAGAARSRPLPGGAGEESARRYLVGSRQLRAKRREKGKPGPSAFPAEGGGVRAALARLRHCSRESGAVRGCPPARPWGGRRGARRPAFRSHGPRGLRHPPRPTGVVPALSSSACGWPGVWVFHRAARRKPRG